MLSPPLQINFFIILPVIALFSSQFLSLHPEGQEYIRICYLDNLDTKFSFVSKKTNKYKTEDAICVKKFNPSNHHNLACKCTNQTNEICIKQNFK